MTSSNLLDAEKNTNYEFKILSALAMILVVCGHNGFGILTFSWLFGYDMFHMPLFIFISGYFAPAITKETTIYDFCAYTQKRFMRLILPFLFWNICYGAFNILIHEFGEFNLTGTTVYEGFVGRVLAPQACFWGLNDPSWFILALFFVSIASYFIQFLLKKKRNKEKVVVICTFVLAIISIAISRFLRANGGVSDLAVLLTRDTYLLFWYFIGYFYKTTMEKKDTMSNSSYFSLVFIFQLILLYCALITGNEPNNGVYMSIFTQSPLLTMCCAANGIALWLRIAKVLTPVLSQSRKILYLANHTFSVMMHHLFFAFATTFVIFKLSVLFDLKINFDTNIFMSNIFYRYIPFGHDGFRIIYVFIGIVGPLMCCYIFDRLKSIYFQITKKGEQHND